MKAVKRVWIQSITTVHAEWFIACSCVLRQLRLQTSGLWYKSQRSYFKNEEEELCRSCFQSLSVTLLHEQPIKTHCRSTFMVIAHWRCEKWTVYKAGAFFPPPPSAHYVEAVLLAVKCAEECVENFRMHTEAAASCCCFWLHVRFHVRVMFRGKFLTSLGCCWWGEKGQGLPR